jgi:aminopeptidase N
MIGHFSYKSFFTVCFAIFGLFSIEGKAQKSESLLQLAEKEAILNSKRFSDIQLVTPANGLNIDVIQYRCHWFVDPSNDSIKGKVAIVFKPKSSAVNSFTLDMANNLLVLGAKFRGISVPTNFTNSSTLSVNLGAQTLQPGQTDSIVIWYHGIPIASPFGSYTRTLHNGVPIIYTLSEPYGAKDWWPCKQALSDKADSVDFTIYTPAPNMAVSNGLQVGFSESNGIRTYRWKHKYPVVTYLLAIAITNYSHFQYKVKLSSGDSLPIDNYSYPENLAEWQSGMLPIKNMVQDFDTLLGPYPFPSEKYGHAQFAFGGGMEHQTISFMQNTNLGLQAHELVHHWFGNKITCGSWRDIWLNEGFATYFGAFEYVKAGLSTWPQEGQQWIDLITSEPGGSVYCSDTTDLFRIFSGRLSYGKGAMLVRMLRYRLGEQAFWTALKTFLASPQLKYGFAKTEDLVVFLEQSSGLDLSEFFRDWYKGEGYPTFQIGGQVNGNIVTLNLNQTSSHPSVTFFEARLPIKISGSGFDTTVFVDHTQNGQIAIFSLPFTATNIQFDPQRFLLAKSNVSLVTNNGLNVSNQNIQILPNPAKDKIEILGLDSETEVILHNSNGGRVQKYSLLDSKRFIDLSEFPSGLFYLKFIGPKGVTIKRLVRN